MATYTNQIPAGLQDGDIISITSGGNYTLPPGQYNVEVGGARGGYGGSCHFNYGTIINGISGWITESKPGYGGLSKFNAQYTKSVLLNITCGSIGAGGTGQSATASATKTGTLNGTRGSAGSATVYRVDGEVACQCNGGGGGGSSSISYGPGTAVNSAYSGTTGANGGVSVAPSGATNSAGGSTGAGYVKITAIMLNQAPSDPKDIEYGTPYANREIEVTWTGSVDSDGDNIEYVLSRSINGKAFETAAVTTEPRATVMVPGTGETIQFRVQAVDSRGGESGFTTGLTKAIIYNWPPVISGNDESRENVTAPFSYTFSVNDPDEQDILSFTVSFDNEVIYEMQDAVRDQNYTVDLEDLWLYTSAGAHKLTVVAKDNNGASTTRTIAFKRVVEYLELETIKPIETDEMVNTVMIFFDYDAPVGSTVLIELRPDPAADWEDVTAFNYQPDIYTFQHTSKSGSKALLDARITIKKPEGSTGDIVFYGATLMLNANGKDSPAYS